MRASAGVQSALCYAAVPGVFTMLDGSTAISDKIVSTTYALNTLLGGLWVSGLAVLRTSALSCKVLHHQATLRADVGVRCFV